MLTKLRDFYRRWREAREVHDGGDKNLTVLDHLRRLDQWKLVKKEC